MTNARKLGDLQSNNILDIFAAIISQLQAIPSNQINSQQLSNTEEKLQEILSQLQFELLNAQEQKNWEQVNQLSLVVAECKNTLNSVRASIFRVNIIGINQQNLAELQKISQDIDTARKTQLKIDFAIHLLGFLRKLFLK
ncbi:hypothetical protein [Dendronalium sp. ChiSLP03b]|uniref:hypothetical protein n=1 Tax=Dendronalium sp. ChiSLP03b TaxID=3075381 RepID=UPI002AD3DF94|nr:hypothetical protein [Dendronalium sp. ChiSLP03b]MDZ8208959.1 hypothetical protein [Dendronalium sp. ChiSLP03b]